MCYIYVLLSDKFVQDKLIDYLEPVYGKHARVEACDERTQLDHQSIVIGDELELKKLKNADAIYLILAKEADNNKKFAKPLNLNVLHTYINLAFQEIQEQFFWDEFMVRKVNESYKIQKSNNHNFAILTKREFEVVYHMMINYEKPLSKEFFFSNVWGIDSSLETHTLESHISKIRKKLGKIGLNISKKTEGYLIVRL